MPPAGKQVKMKWIDGTTEWTGDIIHELANTHKQYYFKLLWEDESPTLESDAVEFYSWLIENSFIDASSENTPERLYSLFKQQSNKVK